MAVAAGGEKTAVATSASPASRMVASMRRLGRLRLFRSAAASSSGVVTAIPDRFASRNWANTFGTSAPSSPATSSIAQAEMNDMAAALVRKNQTSPGDSSRSQSGPSWLVAQLRPRGVISTRQPASGPEAFASPSNAESAPANPASAPAGRIVAATSRGAPPPPTIRAPMARPLASPSRMFHGPPSAKPA